MMLKEKSSPWARLKYLYVLPLAAITVTAFARPEISDKVEEISAVKVNDLAAIVETKVEEMTKEIAGTVSQDSIKELTYSADSIVFLGGSVSMEGDTVTAKGETVELHGARLDNIPKSYKSLIIVNGEEVSRDKLDAMLTTEDMQSRIKNVTLLEGEAAVKIYGEKGKDGVMDIQLLPEDDTHFKITMTKAKIRSKADTSTVVKTISLRNVKGMPIRGVEGKEEPLYIIDGEEVSGPNPLAKIDRDRIESFSVLQKETATTIYGEKGKNGAVLIELKPDNGSQAIEKTQENPYKNAWEDAMELNGPDQVSTKKVVFYVNGKETSEEEMKRISVDEIHGIQKKISVKNDETTILINTDQSTDKWTTAWGTVEDKAGKPIEGAKVVIYGTDTGTVTDANGYYKLRTPKDASIQVTFGSESVTGVKARVNVIIRLDR